MADYEVNKAGLVHERKRLAKQPGIRDELYSDEDAEEALMLMQDTPQLRVTPSLPSTILLEPYIPPEPDFLFQFPSSSELTSQHNKEGSIRHASVQNLNPSIGMNEQISAETKLPPSSPSTPSKMPPSQPFHNRQALPADLSSLIRAHELEELDFKEGDDVAALGQGAESGILGEVRKEHYDKIQEEDDLDQEIRDALLEFKSAAAAAFDGDELKSFTDKVKSKAPTGGILKEMFKRPEYSKKRKITEREKFAGRRLAKLLDIRDKGLRNIEAKKTVSSGMSWLESVMKDKNINLVDEELKETQKRKRNRVPEYQQGGKVDIDAIVQQKPKKKAKPEPTQSLMPRQPNKEVSDILSELPMTNGKPNTSKMTLLQKVLYAELSNTDSKEAGLGFKVFVVSCLLLYLDFLTL